MGEDGGSQVQKIYLFERLFGVLKFLPYIVCIGDFVFLVIFVSISQD